MKMKIWLAQYSEEHEIKTLDEVKSKLISFSDKHELTSKCWINFQITGAGNIKKEIVYDESFVDALFG